MKYPAMKYTGWLKRALLAKILLLAVLFALSLFRHDAKAQPDLSQLRPVVKPVPVAEIERMGQASGLTDCFWAATIGPDSFNIMLPDSHATYWLAQFRLPEGARLSLEGSFPHARHISFNSYDTEGTPVDRLNDVMLRPEPGSGNPFLPGARRDAPERNYRVSLETRALRAGVPVDEATRAASTLYLPAEAEWHQLWYRIYLPDRGLDPRGGAALPQPMLTLADGRSLRGAALCAAITRREGLVRDFGLPVAALHSFFAMKGPGIRSPYPPAQNPAEWYAFFNPPLSVLGLLIGTPYEGLRQAVDPTRRGGFYSTLDNSYMSTYIDRRHGPLLVLQAKAPTTPHTVNGAARMSAAELRYWSFCKYRSLADTAVDGCLQDEEIPLDTAQRYTVVVSTAEDRPANARAECGVAWLDWGKAGDGIGNRDGGFLMLRQMLPAADFRHSVFATTRPGEERAVLGEYYPDLRYMARADFEARGCPVSTR